MSYAVVFTGEINPAFTQVMVINNLASLFKKDAQFIEKLFSGKRVVIKRDMDLDKAKKYHVAMNNAGAIAQLVDQGTNKPVTDDQQYANNIAPVAVDNAEIQSTTLSMAEAGVTIIEHVQTEEPEINIHHLSMSAAGEQIIEQEAIIPADINTDNIDLSPTGSVLSDERIPEALDIDTSGISMADTGSQILGSE